MLIASRGVGTSLSAISHSGRQAQSHLVSNTRALHVPAPATGRGATYGVGSTTSRSTATTTASRVVHEARTALTRFFGHLRTPGFTHPIAETGRYASPTGSRAYSIASRHPTIHSRLSPQVKHSLTGARGTFMPRARVPARSTMDVGLGCARNFSSTRPLFQVVFKNVPVAGRSVCEADLDLKKRNKIAGKKVASMKRDEKENIKTNEMLKETNKAKKDALLSQYFATPASEDVKTVLLVPLAPTPSSRFPISENVAEPQFLPLSSLTDLHASHNLHSLRVSTLFARLDAAKVWDRGAVCAAYGDRSGLCTVLRIEFVGCTMEMVRGIIGGAGKDWCQMVEIRDEDGTESVSSLSISSLSSSVHYGSSEEVTSSIDPSASLVLPTLDFSSAFLGRELDASRTPSTLSTDFPPSPALSCIDATDLSPPTEFSLDVDDPDDRHSQSGSDRFSDFSVPNTMSDMSWEEVMSMPRGPMSVNSISTTSSVSGMGFSSDFVSRVVSPMQSAIY